VPPSYKREIELLCGFVRDLRRLPKGWWDLQGPPYWECEKIEGSLHRRLPGVRAAVTKAGVSFVGPHGEENAYDFLTHALEPKPRANVLRVLEEAIGVFEHRLVPAPPSASTAAPTDLEAAFPQANEPVELEVPLTPHQREIELLAAFARDLKRLHEFGPLLDAKLKKERQELEDALNRRVPAVRRTVERADVPRHGTDAASGRFDYLSLILEKHVFEKVWTILQQAIGVYENEIVPADLRTREEEEKRKREEEERKPSPGSTQPTPLPNGSVVPSPLENLRTIHDAVLGPRPLLLPGAGFEAASGAPTAPAITPQSDSTEDIGMAQASVSTPPAHRPLWSGMLAAVGFVAGGVAAGYLQKWGEFLRTSNVDLKILVYFGTALEYVFRWMFWPAVFAGAAYWLAVRRIRLQQARSNDLLLTVERLLEERERRQREEVAESRLSFAPSASALVDAVRGGER
jgi:tryptophan 2,3-dioxygenase